MSRMVTAGGHVRLSCSLRVTQLSDRPRVALGPEAHSVVAVRQVLCLAAQSSLRLAPLELLTPHLG